MKKVVLTLLTMAALASCTTTEIIDGGSSNDNAIKFGNVATRAGLSDLQANGFGVWATVSSIGSTAVSYQPILEKEHVYLKDGNWTYDNEQMWTSNSIFHFFAAYPHNIGFEQHTKTQNGVNYTAYTLDFTADGSADTNDILVATHVTDTTNEFFSPDAPVEMSFGHLLSRVNVKLRQNFDVDPDFNYYVTKITISGIKGNGTYMVMPYNDSWLSYWDFNNALNIVLEKDFSDNPVLLRNEGAADPVVILKVWDESLMLIPQEFVGGNILVRVDYLYDVNLEDEDKGEPKFVEGFVPAGKIEPGKSVNYTLAIANSSFITFEQPTIDPWGAPQTGGTIIIQ